MSLLVDCFRKEVAKSKDIRLKSEATAGVMYSTGFLSVDFLNGTIIHVYSKDKKFSYNAVGLLDGSATTVIGRSGCGKSTILVQWAANIVRKFPNGAIYHDDAEAGMDDNRKFNLTGFNIAEMSAKYIYRNTGITSENFYQRIRMIHDIKLEHYADFEYDTGLYDSFGTRIYKLQPTVYILDSLPMLMPDKMTEEEELSGQMSTTGAAKTNTRIFRQIVSLLKAANIMLLVINHILDDVQTGPFAKKPQLAYLKVGERLTGGKAAIYLANNMFRMDDGMKLKPTEGFGITGSIVDISVVKSRTNVSGRSIPLVFNQEEGFDNELSLFMLLKSTGHINGAGAYLYIDNHNEIKFSQKSFKDTLHNSPELQQWFSEACYTELYPLLSDNGIQDDPFLEDEDAINTNSTIIDINSIILGYGAVA